MPRLRRLALRLILFFCFSLASLALALRAKVVVASLKQATTTSKGGQRLVKLIIYLLFIIYSI
jgi:hypothetical protein